MSEVQAYRPEMPPPYSGLEAGELWHFSEDPTIEWFEPRPSSDGVVVWAVDAAHAPVFWFPRDCPRVCTWVGTSTSAADREEFFGATGRDRLHVVEVGWERVIADCRLYAYRMPRECFTLIDGSPGYWLSTRGVRPSPPIEVGALVDRHEQAAIDLRVVDNIWAFYYQVAASTLSRTGSRLRNSAHPQPTEPSAT